MRFLTVACVLSLFLYGCGGASQSVPTQQEFDLGADGDPDGDGLSNAVEASLGTSGQLADTDGDGRTDNIEVAEGSNPLVAELPYFDISLEGDFNVVLNSIETDTSDLSITLSRSNTESSSSSVTNTSSIATGISHGWDLRTDVMVGFGTGNTGSSFTVSAGVNGSYSSDTTVGLDSTRSQELSTTLDETQARSESSSVAYDGGALKFQVKISNSSTLGYVLSDLTLNIVAPSENGDRIYAVARPVSSDAITMAPNAQVSTVFEAAMRNDELQQLAQINSPVFRIMVGTVDYRDVTTYSGGLTSTISIAGLLTDAGVRTAGLEINFGGLAANEQHYIAVNTSYDGYKARPVTLEEWLDNAGFDDIRYTAEGGIDSFNDVSSGSSGEWKVYLSNDDSNYTSPLNIKDQLITASHNVIMVYGQDSDGDGLVNFVENTLYGTDPQQADSDNDGLSDDDELFGYLPTFTLDNSEFEANSTRRANPLIADSDADGFIDSQDFYPLRPLSYRNQTIHLQASARDDNGQQQPIRLSESESNAQVANISSQMIDLSFSCDSVSSEALLAQLSSEELVANASISPLGPIGSIELQKYYPADDSYITISSEGERVFSFADADGNGGECAYSLPQAAISIGMNDFRVAVHSLHGLAEGGEPSYYYFQLNNGLREQSVFTPSAQVARKGVISTELTVEVSDQVNNILVYAVEIPDRIVHHNLLLQHLQNNPTLVDRDRVNYNNKNFIKMSPTGSRTSNQRPGRRFYSFSTEAINTRETYFFYALYSSSANEKLALAEISDPYHLAINHYQLDISYNSLRAIERVNDRYSDYEITVTVRDENDNLSDLTPSSRVNNIVVTSLANGQAIGTNTRINYSDNACGTTKRQTFRFEEYDYGRRNEELFQSITLWPEPTIGCIKKNHFALRPSILESTVRQTSTLEIPYDFWSEVNFEVITYLDSERRYPIGSSFTITPDVKEVTLKRGTSYYLTRLPR